MKQPGINDKCRSGSGKKYKKCCLRIDRRAILNDYDNIFLLVGNGLTYDFISELNINNIDPSYPLREFNSDDISYKSFINKIPDVKKHLLNELYEDDFKAIREYVEKFGDNVKKDCQLRRFLAMAYSLLQLKFKEKQNDIWQWKWTKWIYSNKDKLCGSISFNYDLLLENIFSSTSLKYHRPGTVNEYSGIPIVKPHGSIDFDIKDGFIGGINSPEQRWGVKTKLNDMEGEVKVISEDKWLNPRLQADIIPPTQRNYQLKLGWVKRGYNILKRKLNKLDAFLIIGFSYGEADRKEFKRILNLLPKNKEIDFYIIDPNVNKSEGLIRLNELLTSKGYSIDKVTSGLPW